MKTSNGKASARKSKILKNGKVQVFKKPRRINEGDISKLGSNPFKANWRFIATPSDIQFRTIEGDDRKSYTVYNAPGPVLEQVANGNFVPYLIEGKHLRVYLENNDNLRSIIYKLSPTSHSLLIWVLFSLDYGKDYFLLNKAHLMQEMGLSKQTIYKAEKELIETGFISKTQVTHHYWINTQFFLIGNRCHYFPEFVTTKEGKDLQGIKDDFWRKRGNFINRRIQKPEEI